jgi:hypothetical protein
VLGGPEDFEIALNDPPPQYALHSWQILIGKKTEYYTIIWRDLELV